MSEGLKEMGELGGQHWRQRHMRTCSKGSPAAGERTWLLELVLGHLATLAVGLTLLLDISEPRLLSLKVEWLLTHNHPVRMDGKMDGGGKRAHSVPENREAQARATCWTEWAVGAPALGLVSCVSTWSHRHR